MSVRARRRWDTGMHQPGGRGVPAGLLESQAKHGHFERCHDGSDDAIMERD